MYPQMYSVRVKLIIKAIWFIFLFLFQIELLNSSAFANPFNPLNVGNAYINLTFGGNVNGQFLFFTKDRVRGEQSVKLWSVNLSNRSARVLKTFKASGSAIVFNSLLLFTAETSELGAELWASDGTESGTRLVKDIVPGSNSGMSEFIDLDDNHIINGHENFVIFQDQVLFMTKTSQYGREIWRTTGTPESTQIFVEGKIGSASGVPIISNPFEQPIVVTKDGSGIFFVCIDSTGGEEVCYSDGTQSNTRIVKT